MSRVRIIFIRRGKTQDEGGEYELDMRRRRPADTEATPKAEISWRALILQLSLIHHLIDRMKGLFAPLGFTTKTREVKTDWKPL